MFEYFSLILFIFFIVFLIVLFASRSSCLIDDSLYPELHIFKPNNELMYEDLKYAITANAWVDLSNMNKLYKDNMEPLYTRVKTIKYFIFKGNDTIVDTNVQMCPNIITLINAIPGVQFSAILCIKSGTVTDNISLMPNMQICFIPISESNNEFGLIVNNYIYRYSDLLKNIQFLIIDSNCKIQVYNEATYNKYMIILYLATKAKPPKPVVTYQFTQPRD